MKLNVFFVCFITIVFLTTNSNLLNGQETQKQQPIVPENLRELLPQDANVTTGKLENGLTYYIRENKKPEQRAELRLVVNAGSVLEEDDQQGLAHFVEHMAFNGTLNFAKHEIVDYLESIGMRFGPDINAYTNFDETVYMLQIPTDSAEVVEKAFQIMEDWAYNISFAEEEIVKERGVVVEEWRLGRGAGARMLDKQFPILFKNSKYAQRLPIGKKEIVEASTYDKLFRFYQDWYRPDLMAVIAVGDFDRNWIKELIQKHFNRFKAAGAKERKLFPVPNHDETLFAIASDVEATATNVSLYFKHEVEEQKTHRAYRNLINEILYNSMLNNRLDELLQQPEPPFLGAISSKGRLIRSKDFYYLAAAVKENGIQTGLEALLTEAERVKLHGFTETELEREKAEMLRGIEQAFNERDKTESSVYAAEYIRNFLTAEPIPGIEYEFELYKKYIPNIRLQEVNILASQWISDKNRVILVSSPEKEGVHIPSEKELLRVFETVARKEIAAYEDRVPELALLEKIPIPGKIVEEKVITEIAVTEWTLSNGVKVVLKPTDFKNDEILFTAFSPGGHSLISDENYVAAISAASIIQQGGVGNFDQIALQKKLSGKLVNVSPWINELQEGFYGSTAPQDMETLFQLIYLYFTSPRKDSTAFLSFQNRIKGAIRNRHVSPEAAYQDTIKVTMSNYHFRRRPWSEEVLDEMNLETSYRIYQDRFADASDFTFFFVGNFDLETIKPLIKTYLGGLPAFNRKENWRDVGIHPPEGIIEKEVHKGLEPKSQVSIIFTGPFKWERQNTYLLNSMTSVLRIKLREVLREAMGGTYGVNVWASTSHYPEAEYSINIFFGCSPQRVDELTETVFNLIDSLKTFGTTEKYLQKVKENQIRTRETDLKENGFWLNALRAHYHHQEDARIILAYNDLVENLSLDDIKQAARIYLNKENYVKVILYPEE